MRKVATGSAKFLAKSSGTTKGEVRGVVQSLKKGTISKGAAVKALRGGPTAGVKRSKTNTKKVKKAIRTMRQR